MPRNPIANVLVLAALALPALLMPAHSRDMVRHGAVLGEAPITVNVSFNIQMPLDSLDEAAIVEAQKNGRALIYRLARNECQTLLEEIAETCRLTNLNASTQIPQPRRMNPLYINLSGNAQFAISLKAEE
jgi:hypothetical protein